MKLEDTEALAEKVMAFGVGMFAHFGQVQPMWDMVLPTGMSEIYMTPFGDSDEKRVIFDTLRAMVEERGIIRYAFICEVWQRKEPLTEKLTKGVGQNVELHPDREEGLSVISEDISGNQVKIFRRILRPEKGIPVLMKPDKETTKSGFELSGNAAMFSPLALEKFQSKRGG